MDSQIVVAPRASPELLQTIMDTSLRAFGYFDDYCPYRIVYPWILSRLLELSSGARVLDLGAGVNPLPVVLAERGLHVDCVDRSNVVRKLPVTDNWNGWGFFDYATIHRNLRSFQCAAENFVPSCRYDAVYSAGMFAHLPAMVRAATFARCRHWLPTGAALLIYLDVIPNSDFIWNRCEGKEIEASHGTTDDVLLELEAAQFEVRAIEIFRHVPAARTDILLVHGVACLVDV